jgi:hypothetical protein
MGKTKNKTANIEVFNDTLLIIYGDIIGLADWAEAFSKLEVKYITNKLIHTIQRKPKVNLKKFLPKYSILVNIIISIKLSEKFKQLPFWNSTSNQSCQQKTQRD